MDTSDYKIESGKGCIFNGQADSGKTHRLCKMVIETRCASSTVFISFL